MKKIYHIFNILHMDKWWQDPMIACKRNGFISIMLAIAALLMLIMNIFHHSTLMTYCSVILVMGFIISMLFSFIWKKPNISSHIIAGLVCLILSIFAVTGGNEGFAALWILLVPFFSIGLLGPQIGVAISTYFLIFVIALFYSPLSSFIIDKYTDSFINRFPILYMCDCIISTYLALQAEYFERLAHIRSCEDELTGLYNRRYFIEKLNTISTDTTTHLTAIIIDINGLKHINDTKGHLAGDELIVALSKCIRRYFDQDTIISRIGGDEFAMLTYLPDDEVEENLNRMRKAASCWKGKQINDFTFSAGCVSKSQYPDATPEKLLQLADKCMYEDKARFYSQSDNERRKRHS